MKKFFMALLICLCMLFVSAFEFSNILLYNDEFLSLENSRPTIMSCMKYIKSSYKLKGKNSKLLEKDDDIYLIDLFFTLSDVSFDKSKKSEKFLIMSEDCHIISIDLFYNGTHYHFSESYLDTTSD